ncbi:MAG: Uma2 family endonuclease [Planctomycetes bacterium]|nr:Uma2 family endonuclease [Planctomycetota bacterium]
MSTLSAPRSRPRSSELSLLENGDRMKQPEFHRRYLAYPEEVKFELIGGIVYMASPLRWPHGLYHIQLAGLFFLYTAATPGTQSGDNTTVILGEESEPQPDLVLRILAERGGHSRENQEEYLEGPPELIAEIAYSSRAIDLHQKKEDYQKAGVLEYLVLSVESQELYWFSFETADLLKPNRKGVYGSRVFPGLWINGPALLAQDSSQLAATVQEGIRSRGHTQFVKRLQAARRKGSQ